ncbi:MAG TPA: gliding motility-associated ABC transporter ATP-binding subunit GldA [Cyclobacteriaceae bacterium]|nr:gliding motility-associated ABC transporter ATP-binding subunit GldA [Cyclobacteriaceae bacterium]
MTLQIRNLTKIYGRQRAVDNISFDVGRGEIVGFLGPNGAGKSTTMKIATTYLPPTSGNVLIEGLDVTRFPQKIKRIIGYLPEHNPLYTDLYVREYLRFAGRFYGLRGRTLTSAVDRIIEVCGLTAERHKRIELLSKGYRQRVGLAQALLHDPRIVILDEPTSGLDPNQILEIRKLIRETSRDKTVIFSTHILQEVQALCDRVVVINKGKVVADDKLERLLSHASRKPSIVVEFGAPADLAELGRIPGIAAVDQLEGNRYRLTPSEGDDPRPEIFRYAADRNLPLLGLRQEEGSLEDVFRDLTLQSQQA